jgi:type II secretory pathway component PulC
MRTLLLSMVFLPWSAACAPKVSTGPSRFDDMELNKHQAMPAEQAPAEAPAPPRPEAAPGKGLRSGTIARSRLNAVLDAGPGTFLRQLEVTPKKQGERFVGWELVQVIDRASPLSDVDLVVGDVLLAINGKPISRPDQLQTVWESLRTASEVTAQLWRGESQLTLAFTVDPNL